MKLHLKSTLLFILTFISTGLAETALEVRFIESAPKDRFVIQNLSDCNLNDFTLTIDLKDSAGKLIFDTTETGAGVEVFQPFEIVSGNIKLVSQDDETNTVNDGDTALTIRISDLASKESAIFTIDLDDTLTNSDLGMIRVTGSEIENGVINITTANEQLLSATFNNKSTATLNSDTCF